jgi:hypothetical protein
MMWRIQSYESRSVAASHTSRINTNGFGELLILMAWRQKWCAWPFSPLLQTATPSRGLAIDNQYSGGGPNYSSINSGLILRSFLFFPLPSLLWFTSLPTASLEHTNDTTTTLQQQHQATTLSHLRLFYTPRRHNLSSTICLPSIPLAALRPCVAAMRSICAVAPNNTSSSRT